MVIFDEISLMLYIEYKKHEDRFVSTINDNITDHALVFMIRGVTKKRIQLLCYKFCKNTSKSAEIKDLITSFILASYDAGM